jgi:signal transduction histidine kinase
MRRLRLAIVALALALAVPVARLVARALASVELERRVTHQAVAARAFDEMERELSAFLEREEARSFEDWMRPEASPGTEFVIARFEIQPDGALRVAPSGRDPLASDALAKLVRRAWPEQERREHEARLDDLAKKKEALAQAPGTTVPLAQDALASENKPMLAPPSARSERGTAYEALASLNRAAEERASKQAAKLERDESYSSSARPRALIAAAPPPEAPQEIEESIVLGVDEQGASGARADRAAEPARPAAAPAADDYAAEPLLARPLDAESGRLLLYRTLLRAGGGTRQGIVVDLEQLGRWLDARVLGPSRLRLRWGPEFVPSTAPQTASSDGPFSFQHRFAEPFDAFAVRLGLQPLSDLGYATPIWGLALLALLVGTAGLLALYRMVSVRVHFAERRQNFVAAVSHELKTPLTAIRMYAEMLRDGLVDSDEKRDRYHRTITDESERLSRLIDNVLEFSRLERGARELRLVLGPIGPVLEEAAQKLQPHAARSGFELLVDVEPGLPALRFDRDALLQILFNLVDNALKYAASAARREIRLEARRHSDGRRVVVSVRDFGPGVAREHQARVFEPFYRGGSELVRSAPGAGIGLALVKDLGERMGAAVSGQKAEDGGFRVRLVFETPAASAS